MCVFIEIPEVLSTSIDPLESKNLIITIKIKNSEIVEINYILYNKKETVHHPPKL